MSEVVESSSVVPLIAAAAVAVAVVLLAKKFLSKPASYTEEKKQDTPLAMATEADAVFLTRKKQEVPLVEIIELSHDTRLFRFGLPTPDTVLGLPVGKHFTVFGPNRKGVVEGEWNGRADPEAVKAEISRKYTPTSSDDDKGHFDLVIKVYRGGEVDRFPDGGKLSQHFDQLKLGDMLTIQGPYGLIEYQGKSKFSIKRKPVVKSKIGMIAGGTGITPMLQIITAILKDSEDPTQMWLLFANQTEADILMRDTLDKLAAENPDRLKVWYTLDRPGDDWQYSTGFVNEEMLREHMPAAGDDSMVLMCGPPPMIKFACTPNLTSLGFPPEAQVTF